MDCFDIKHRHVCNRWWEIVLTLQFIWCRSKRLETDPQYIKVAQSGIRVSKTLDFSKRPKFCKIKKAGISFPASNLQLDKADFSPKWYRSDPDASGCSKMWSRHLKYLRSNSLINDPLLPSPIFVPCIYGSGFRSLVHCHKALAFCHIRHWLGAPEEHLSKDNTSVSMPYQQFLLGAQPNFDWTKQYLYCHWNAGTC